MNENSKNTMMLVKSSWNDKQTFRMIPISNDCPYVECILDPGTKVFVIISTIKKTSLHMLPKLDGYGNPETGAKGQRQARHTMEVFQEFYLEDREAIESVIKLFAVNSTKFDWKKMLDAKVEEAPLAPVLNTPIITWNTKKEDADIAFGKAVGESIAKDINAKKEAEAAAKK